MLMQNQSMRKVINACQTKCLTDRTILSDNFHFSQTYFESKTEGKNKSMNKFISFYFPFSPKQQQLKQKNLKNLSICIISIMQQFCFIVFLFLGLSKIVSVLTFCLAGLTQPLYFMYFINL